MRTEARRGREPAGESPVRRPRPQACWVQRPDADGVPRLVMTWSVPGTASGTDVPATGAGSLSPEVPVSATGASQPGRVAAATSAIPLTRRRSA